MFLGRSTQDLDNKVKNTLSKKYEILPMQEVKRHTWTKQRHDTQHNVIQHNDTQHNDTQHNDTQHNDTQHNETQHNDTQHNST